MKPDSKLIVEGHPMVYEPSEDSYLLLEHIEVRENERVLEIGTGSGLIALHCAKIAYVTATDINPHAVELTKRNAILNSLELDVVKSDLFEGLNDTFDVIIFNPPYLKEDEMDRKEGGELLAKAWGGGTGGEEIILRFLGQAKDYLRTEGRIYLLLSSNNTKALDLIIDMYHAKELGEKKLFFEAIKVYRLTL